MFFTFKRQIHSMRFYLKKIFAAGLSVCIILTACKEEKKIGPKDRPNRPTPKVEGYIVRTEGFAESIQLPGTIVANEVTEIHPEVAGRIVSLNVREGQYVSKGTVLAKLFDGDLQAQLKKYQAQLAIATVNENRAQQLVNIQGISKQDYDATLLNVRNIQADINIVRTEIAKTFVRAPFSGKMGLKNISVGAYVTPATVIATINQTNTLKIDFSVPEKYITKLHNGQVVSFTVEGNNKIYAARITATESNVTANNRSLMVRGVITGSTAGLMPGGFATVTVSFAAQGNTIFVPGNAIVSTAKGKQVIIAADSLARFVDVETGVRDSARVEITRGLKVGDTVITTGIMALKPEMKVQISKIIK